MYRNPLYFQGDPEYWEEKADDPILGEGRKRWETSHDGCIPDTLEGIWEAALSIINEHFEFQFAPVGGLGEIDSTTLDAPFVALLRESGICPPGPQHCEVTLTRKRRRPAPLTENTAYWFLQVFNAVYCDTQQRFADLVALGAAYWELVLAAESEPMKRGCKNLRATRKGRMTPGRKRVEQGWEVAAFAAELARISHHN
ncbi:MAG: hypothetical protein H3C30_04160 [Candidatus Hydrogenedentes bacterium]|nr:hypothetical protein [Candidatus Hydrogenedentota bacterium]